jgi:hypothetical protein
MRGRDDGQSRLWTELSPGIDIETLPVNWHRHGLCSGGQECPTRSRIPGIFDPGRISWIKQHTRDQIEGTLRSGGEDNLFR